MIRLKQKILNVFLMVLSSVACNNKCEDFDEMPDFGQLENIDGVGEIDLDCIDYVDLPRTYVIQTDSVYQNMLGPLMGSGVPYCQPDTLPMIDFTNRTLLWGITYDETVSKVVLRSGNTITYLFKIKTINFPIGRFRMNAITIPKTSVQDTIIFESVRYGCE